MRAITCHTLAPQRYSGNVTFAEPAAVNVAALTALRGTIQYLEEGHARGKVVVDVQ